MGVGRSITLANDFNRGESDKSPSRIDHHRCCRGCCGGISGICRMAGQGRRLARRRWLERTWWMARSRRQLAWSRVGVRSRPRRAGRCAALTHNHGSTIHRLQCITHHRRTIRRQSTTRPLRVTMLPAPGLLRAAGGLLSAPVSVSALEVIAGPHRPARPRLRDPDAAARVVRRLPQAKVAQRV